MPSAYAVTIKRTILQEITLVRSGDRETAINKAFEEAQDDGPYLGWETVDVADIEFMEAELVGPEHDD